MWGGDPEGAQPAFAESVTVGQRFDDIDLLTMSRLGQGMCLVMQGHGLAGIALLDELMVGSPLAKCHRSTPESHTAR